MKISKQLAAFAFVRDEYERSGDIVRGLTPLFIPALHPQRGQKFSPTTFADEVKKRYDIPMTPLAAEGLSAKLEKAGLLVDESDQQGVSIYRVPANLPARNLESTDEVEDLVATFVSFVEAEISRHGFSADPEDIEEELLRLIRTQEFFSSYSNEGTDFFRGNTLTLREAKGQESSDSEKSQFDLSEFVAIIAAKYFTELRESAPEKLEAFSYLVSGVLISETVLTLQEPSSMDELESIKACLDAPLLLDFLDLNTPEQADYAAQLMESIISAGLQPCVYLHSVREMREVIQAPITAMRSGNRPYGLLGTRLMQDPDHLAYARSILLSLEETLREKGIEILDSDEINEDEDYQQANLEDRLFPYSGAMHSDIKPRHRDVKSVSYSWYLRGDDYPRSLVDTSVIFISRNNRLVRQVQGFFRRDEEFYEGMFPPIITDSELACLLWFAAGGNASNLTAVKLVANCAAAIEPKKDIVSSMRQVLFDSDKEKLSHFEALMGDRRARACLTVEALGDRQILSVRRANEILEEMRQSLAADKDRELASRVLQERRRSSSERAAVEHDLRRERERRSQVEIERHRIESEREQLKSEEERRAARVEDSVRRLVKKNIRIYRALVIIIVVIVVGILTTVSNIWVSNLYVTVPIGVVLALFGSIFLSPSLRKCIERRARERTAKNAADFGFTKYEIEVILSRTNQDTHYSGEQ